MCSRWQQPRVGAGRWRPRWYDRPRWPPPRTAPPKACRGAGRRA